MKRRFLATFACVILAGAGIIGCREAENKTEQVAESSPPPPLLVVDTETPLLLDEPGKAEALSGADNSPCFVCHVNYSREPLAVNHAKHDIGCVACHGDSFAHRNDENNTTPPDKLVASEDIDKVCGKCHRKHDVDPKSVIARWQERGIKKEASAIVCTDCHGDHRLKVRTVRWNKKTGELLKQE